MGVLNNHGDSQCLKVLSDVGQDEIGPFWGILDQLLPDLRVTFYLRRKPDAAKRAQKSQVEVQIWLLIGRVILN